MSSYPLQRTKQNYSAYRRVTIHDYNQDQTDEVWEQSDWRRPRELVEDDKDDGEISRRSSEDSMSQTTVQEVVLEAIVEVDRQSVKEVEVNGFVSNGGMIVNGGTPSEKIEEADLITQLHLLRDYLLELPYNAKSKALEFWDFAHSQSIEGLKKLETNAPMLKDIAVKSIAVLLALSAIFSFVVAYRVSKTFNSIEDTYFCRGLSWVDSTLGTGLSPALCSTFHEDLYTEAQQEAGALLEELHGGFCAVIRDICKGLVVIIRLIAAIVNHFFAAVFDGLYELWDNMTDNLSFLSDFLVATYHFMENALWTVIGFLLNGLSRVYHSIGDLFIKEERGWFS